MKERETALDILRKVFRDNAYISLLMRDLNHEEINVGYVSEIVYGTVRNYSLLEYQWRRYVHSRVHKKTALVLDMSCYQLFFMEKEAPYAVVNEAVKLAGRDGSLVNAVLHHVCSGGLQHSSDLSVETSHPAWLLNLWKAHYGEEIMRKTAFADQKRGIVFGRINQLKTDKETLEKDTHIHFLNDLSFHYDGSIQHSRWFKEGMVLIQDIHSAEVPQALAVLSGMNVLDICAAPGTKTQETAALMNNQGEITAGDIYPERTRLIEQLMKNTGVSIVQTEVKDASKPDMYQRDYYDRILCDVPCSGLGDLRHKPEIRLHVTPGSMDELVKLQKKILDNASAYLKKGGRMVYSTCTLNKKENERQIKRFLEDHKDFQCIYQITRYPFEDEGDGFYHAVLIKK